MLMQILYLYFQLSDLRAKVRHNRPKRENEGRSEFGSVRELVNYILDEDKRAKERTSGVK